MKYFKILDKTTIQALKNYADKERTQKWWIVDVLKRLGLSTDTEIRLTSEGLQAIRVPSDCISESEDWIDIGDGWLVPSDTTTGKQVQHLIKKVPKVSLALVFKRLGYSNTAPLIHFEILNNTWVAVLPDTTPFPDSLRAPEMSAGFYWKLRTLKGAA